MNEIARKKGLDVAAMRRAIESDNIPDIVNANRAMAENLGVEGTPAFIVASVDGSYVEVVPGFDRATLEAKIKEAKKAARR